ncbi:hypothetical protein ABK040_009395 [Willaertia magna]
MDDNLGTTGIKDKEEEFKDEEYIFSEDEDEEQYLDESNLSLEDEKDEDKVVNNFSAATKLLEKRNRMIEIQSTLGSKRSEFQGRMDNIKKKEKELIQRKHELTENVRELDKFIGDNIIKKKRADQKREIEQSERIKIEKALSLSLQRIRELERERDKKEMQLQNKYLRYQTFLQKVVLFRGDDNPEDVDKVIDRYDTLSEKNTELRNEKQKNTIKLQREKNKLIEVKEAMKNEKIRLNHTISTLGKRLEKIIDERLTMDLKIDRSSSTSVTTRKQLGQIEMAINNLYTRVTSGGSRIQRRIMGKPAINTNSGLYGNVNLIGTGSFATTSGTTSNLNVNMGNVDSLLKMLKVIGDCVGDYTYISDVVIKKQIPEKERETYKKSKT